MQIWASVSKMLVHWGDTGNCVFNKRIPRVSDAHESDVENTLCKHWCRMVSKRIQKKLPTFTDVQRTKPLKKIGENH